MITQTVVDNIEIPKRDMEAEKEELINQINFYTDKALYANQLLNAAHNLGYGENHCVVQTAIKEINNAISNKEFYQNKLNEIIKKEKEYDSFYKEYPIATVIWFYLQDLGYNDYVCAGILGNIMAEVGGNTLNIQPYSIGGIHYGICQWNKDYCPEVWGTDLITQLDYLKNSIEPELNTFGFVYKKNFNYKTFLQMKDASEVAYAFAKVYERCHHSHYEVRRTNALIAYNFFVD